MINKRWKSCLACSYSCFSYLIFLPNACSYQLSYVCIPVLIEYLWRMMGFLEASFVELFPMQSKTLIEAIERETQLLKFVYNQHMIQGMCEKSGEGHMYCFLFLISIRPNRCVKKASVNIHMHWNMISTWPRRCVEKLL